MNNVIRSVDISAEDRTFLDLLRGVSITRVVLVHLGLSWFYSPYTEFVHAFLPVLFFVSGAVSYSSYLRCNTLSTYLYKRILSIYIPYITIVAVSLLFSFVGFKRLPSFGIYQVFDFLTFNIAEIPKYMPYPLGQVWFLHALVIVIIITAPFFKLSSKTNFYFYLLMVISLLISFLQLFFNYGKNFYFLGHNMYQPLSNLGFFIFGSLYYSDKLLKPTLLKLIFLSLIVFITSLFFVNDINMYKHSYSPDLYYVSLSYFIIFFIIYASNSIKKTITYYSFVANFFIFMSKNAYSVYLLHSLVLWFIHNKIGLGSVKHSPGLAILKIISVVIFTCIISVPYTKLTNFIKGIIISKSRSLKK